VSAAAPQLTGFIDLYTRLRSSTEQWDRVLWQLLCELRVAMPGVVTEIQDSGRVTVQPAVLENLLINSTPTPVAIPPLRDVRVVMMRGGGLSITLPVEIGDECLLIFMDMCTDFWEQSGGTQNIQWSLDTLGKLRGARRRHDLSDAVAIFGPWNQTRNLSDYSSSSLQIRTDDGNTYVEVIEGQINVAQNLTVENGASGSFTTQTGQVVTVVNGIITSIT